LRAFVAESRALSAVLRQLEPREFQRATNCPPWDLAELVVHVAMSITVDDTEPLSAAPGGALRAAADYYRRPERDTPQYRQGNVDRTQQVAATILATTSAGELFDQRYAASVSVLSRRDPGQIVHIPGVGPMILADWVTTRVMSVAAHGLDVALTVGRPPWTTPAALTELEPVLISLLGMQLPAQLGWDDQTLLTVGTGRRRLTEAERAIVGPAHRRFPLLS
jgi:uncharacterized protein (TIGR03083 family)